MTTKRDRYIVDRQNAESYYRKSAENYAILNNFQLIEEDLVIFKVQNGTKSEFAFGTTYNLWFNAWTKLRLNDQGTFDFHRR